MEDQPTHNPEQPTHNPSSLHTPESHEEGVAEEMAATCQQQSTRPSHHGLQNYHPHVHHSLAELEAVLPRIRFPLMSAEELNNIAGHPLAAVSSVLQMLLAEARGSASRASSEVCD